jgi:hypothetical protein
MLPGIGTAALRAAAVVPAMLLVVFSGLLWLLGLPCDGARRDYVLKASQQAMTTASVLLHGPAVNQRLAGLGRS